MSNSSGVATNNGNGMIKTLGSALLVISVIGSGVATGYNLRSLAFVQDDQTEIKRDYVRKDVQSEQLQRMSERLSEVLKQVEELRSEIRQGRRPQ